MTFESLMRTLWEGQTSRHGNQNVTTPEALESSCAAVHLAATLVQRLASSTIDRLS